MDWSTLLPVLHAAVAPYPKPSPGLLDNVGVVGHRAIVAYTRGWNASLRQHAQAIGPRQLAAHEEKRDGGLVKYRQLRHMAPVARVTGQVMYALSGTTPRKRERKPGAMELQVPLLC